MFTGFDFLQKIFPIMFITVFFIIIFVFIFTFVRIMRQRISDNRSPVLTVDAAVTGKREDFSVHHHGNSNMHMHSSTDYYVTFQVESGDRMEFSVSGQEYGLLSEGDTGKLTFQGSRYLSFERN